MKEIEYHNLKLFVNPETYEPSEDSFLLADNLPSCKELNVLDMGCGCGIIGLKAAKLGARKVVMIDINPHAVACSLLNAKINNLLDRVDIRVGNLFDALKPEEKFHLITFNPPYLLADKPKTWIDLAWTSGRNEATIIHRFLEKAEKHLEKNGRILLIISSKSKPTKILKQLRKLKYNARVKDKLSFFFERIYLLEIFQDL